jgi:S1-C subfamily serine protease
MLATSLNPFNPVAMKAVCLAGVFLLVSLPHGAADEQPVFPAATNAPAPVPTPKKPAPPAQKFKPVSLAQITTRDGTTYQGVTVQKVDPDGLMVEYRLANGGTGLAKLKFPDLPASLQEKFGYDAEKAAAFEAEQRQAIGQWRARLIADDEAARAKRQAEELVESEKEARNSGTGFFITDDGYLLTSFHVVNNATRIRVGTKRDILPAALVRADPVNDLALLKVAGAFQSLPLVASNSAKLGESVFTVGFPNPPVQGMEPKLTRGEISGLNGLQDDPRTFQISVPVQPGNSGGALVDEYGNVVGIVSARLSDAAAVKTSGMLPQNVNYAVKSPCARPVLESVPELPDKLSPPHPARSRRFEDVVREAQNAVALVLVY